VARTRIRGSQILLSEIFSVERILAARGLTVLRADNITQTLMRISEPTEAEIADFFVNFDTTEKRRAILASIVVGSGEKYNDDRKRFSTTLEWYIGELLVRKFQAFSSAFGVRVRNTIRPTADEMGDFDVLAVLGDMTLFYAECKSGEVKFDEIQKAVERGLVLGATATVIIYEKDQDVRLLLKGKIYPGLDHACRTDEIAVTNLNNSNILMWHDAFFLDASNGLENKIQTCLRLVAQRKNGYLQVFGADVEYLAGRGFAIS
jgi:hypothetical protein